MEKSTFASGEIKVEVQNSRKPSSTFWHIILLVLLVSSLQISIQYKKVYAAIVEDQIQLKASAAIASKREYLSDILGQLENQVRVLVDNPFTQAYVLSNTKSSLNNLTQLFLTVSTANEYYMQVRFLDAQGQERVRIDRPRDGSGPRIIPGKELQDKSSRGYFKSTKKLPKGQIWSSKFDLNRERGAIEKPINPTFRVASPVYSGGKFSGMVIINLAMSRVASVLDDSTDFLVFLVDGDGEFLHHPDPHRAWSRYLPDRTGYLEHSEKGQTFSHALEDLFKNGEEIRLILKPIQAAKSPLSAPGQEVILTQEEKEWIKQHTVKVGIEEWAPIVFTQNDGKVGGLAGSYLDTLAQRTGLKFEIVSDEWNTLLIGLREKDIDLLPATYYTDERATYGFYSSAYFTSREFIYVKEDSHLTSIDDLSKGSIAVLKGYGTIPKIREKYPHATIVETNNLMDSITRVLNGEVDALLEAQIVVEHAIRINAIIGLKGISQNVFPASPIYLFSRNDAPLLKSILQKGLDSISEEESEALQKQWISIANTDSDKVKLTPADQQWLSKHKVIRLGIDISWPPFEFLDDSGNYAGLSAGYIKALNRRLDISMEPILGLSWSQVINKVKQGDLDLLPAVVRTPQREKFLNFTQPYISSPMVIAIRKGEDVLIGSLNDLKGKRIGVVKGYASFDLLKEGYPDLILVEKTNVAQLLRDLDAGEIDAAVENVGAISYALEQLNLNNVQIAAPTPYSYDISIGVRKDWPELVSILDKAIASLDKEEKEAIKNTWMAHQVKFGLDTKTILLYAAPVLAGVIIILLVIVIWNRRLSGEIADRKLAEQKLSAMSEAVHDALVMIDAQARIMYWNNAAEQMFGLSADKVMGHDLHAIISPENVRDQANKGLETFAKNGKGPVIGALQEINAVRGNGELFPAEVAVAAFQVGDAWHAVGTIRDITERRAAEEELVSKEKRLRNYFSTSQIGVAITHPTDGWIEVNDRALEMLGYTFDELKKISWMELTHPDDLEADQIQYNQMLAGEIDRYTMEKRFIRKDETILYVNLGVSCVRNSDNEAEMVLASYIDVTDRKIAEMALADNEARYRELVENANSIIIKLDKEGNITFVNEFAQEFFGYLSNEIIGKSIVGTIVPEAESSGRDLDELMRDMIAHPELYEHNENENIRKNGDRVWVSWTNKAIFTDDGKTFVELLCIGTDITERRQARKALKESEERVTTILNSINTGIVIIDPESRMIMDVNPVASQMIGLSKKEIIGRSCHEFICPRKENDCPIIDHGQTIDNAERVLVTAEGNEIPILKTVVSVDLAGKRHLLESFVDITKRKAAEKELQQHLEELERFYQITINREEKMIELKAEINQLLARAGEKEKYKIR